MPVDKFGRNYKRTTTIYTGLNIENLTNTFLRRDGGNTTLEAIDMNNNIIKNVVDPLTYQDIATKNYVDTKADVGGVVFGNIKLSNDLTWRGVWNVMILLKVRSLHFCWGQPQIC